MPLHIVATRNGLSILLAKSLISGSAGQYLQIFPLVEIAQARIRLANIWMRILFDQIRHLVTYCL